MSNIPLPPHRDPSLAPPVRGSPGGTSWLWNTALLLMVLLGAGVLLGWVVAAWRPTIGPRLDPTATARPIVPAGNLETDERDTIEMFRQCSQSVVHITAMAVGRDRFSFNPVEIPRGTGSGFVWDDKGHIVTNYHVVASAAQRNDTLRVRLADQSTQRAQIVGVDPNNDLAVLQLEEPPSNLVPIPLGTSSDLQVGQKALAIGNPFGLDQTLTTGVISGLGREIKADNGRAIFDVIQTDAAINPGNSGGPLLDSSGRLIGVNTAIYSPSGAYAGIGFAIPVDTVNRVIPQLLRHGLVVRPGFGIQIANDQIVRQLGLDGVLVLQVQPGGAADEAGFQSTEVDDQENIRLGDVIVEVDGTKVQTSEGLFKVLERKAVGDQVEVKILRNARTGSQTTLTKSVTLRALDAN